LVGKIGGLYGRSDEEDAYDALPQHQQEALSLLSGRLAKLGLWRGINRIVRVYGEGGVGMNFEAVDSFENELRGRKDFTSLLARRDNTGGFFEKGRRRASLHFLYIDRGGAKRDWHVHFDFYAPMGSAWSAVQHLYYERFGNVHPDWRMIRNLLSEGDVATGA
jgi:hypothetical protein